MANDRRGSDHSHLIDFPEALEAFFLRVGELKGVLGPGAGDGVDRLEAIIQRGLAARERGDVPEAIARITEAMNLLADLAGTAPGLHGPMLRAMALQFRDALGRGSVGDAKATAEVMRTESGSTVTPKKRR